MPHSARSVMIAALPMLLASACNDQPAAPPSEQEVANAAAEAPAPALLAKGDGSPAGTVTLTEDPNGVTVRINASGLSEGTHGVHLHTVGRCEGPKFESAGSHWNPGLKKHGRDSPAGAHMGDLANLEVGADGNGSSTFAIGGARLKDGANAVGDGDGTALVIHAKRDDYKTDPSGDSGDRIACAVVSG